MRKVEQLRKCVIFFLSNFLKNLTLRDQNCSNNNFQPFQSLFYYTSYVGKTFKINFYHHEQYFLQFFLYNLADFA